MENPSFASTEDSLPDDKDEPNKHLAHIYENNDYSDDRPFLDSNKNSEIIAKFPSPNHFNGFIDSPRSNLAKFIPENPFKLDNDFNQHCESKVFVRPVEFTNGCKSFHVSLSVEDEPEYDDNTYSKSCDCSEDILQSLPQRTAVITRSISEDYLGLPNGSFQRRISLVSTSKGKLMAVPRVRPGEKIVKSPSVSSQHPSRPPKRLSVESEDEEVPFSVRFSSEKRWICFCLCLVDFTAFLSMSIIAPFFPREAKDKGMREAVSGFVFSIYALVVMLSSPIFGKLLPTVGAKFMFLVGVGFCGACNILFGLLDKVQGQTEFTVLCFVVRSFEALGAAAFCTASCTILIDQFPDDIGTVFGFTETCIGVGMSIGPAIGGALYAVGGFGLPFFTLGGCVILIVPICFYLLRNVEDPKVVLSTTVSYKKLLSMPHVIIVCIILAVASQAQGFIDPTLEPHMRQYNLDTSIIGLLFLLLSGAYAISSPIVGWVSGKVENKYPIMIVGLIFVVLSLLLIGPSEILPIDGSVWLSIVALTLLGFSFAAAYVPTFESMFIAAMNGGLEDDINTYSVVSGLWNSMYSLGEVTGPLLGGVLSDFFKFPQAATLMAFCTLAAFVIAVIAWVNPCQCFGPYSLVEDAEEKMGTPEESAEVSRAPSREETPLHDSNVNSYGSLIENKKDPVV